MQNLQEWPLPFQVAVIGPVWYHHRRWGHIVHINKSRSSVAAWKVLGCSVESSYRTALICPLVNTLPWCGHVGLLPISTCMLNNHNNNNNNINNNNNNNNNIRLLTSLDGTKGGISRQDVSNKTYVTLVYFMRKYCPGRRTATMQFTKSLMQEYLDSAVK